MQIEQLHREMLGRSSPPPGDPWHKGSKRTWEWVWPLARRGYEAGASINVGAVLWDVAKQGGCGTVPVWHSAGDQSDLGSSGLSAGHPG